MRHKTYPDFQIDRHPNPSSGPGGDNSREREYYKRIVWEGMKSQLTPKQQEAMLLYYGEELTVCQLAQRLGIHPSSASRRLAGAVQRIQRFAAACRACRPPWPES